MEDTTLPLGDLNGDPLEVSDETIRAFMKMDELDELDDVPISRYANIAGMDFNKFDEFISSEGLERDEVALELQQEITDHLNSVTLGPLNIRLKNSTTPASVVFAELLAGFNLVENKRNYFTPGLIERKKNEQDLVFYWYRVVFIMCIYWIREVYESSEFEIYTQNASIRIKRNDQLIDIEKAIVNLLIESQSNE